MRGPTRADAIAAVKTALGNEEYKSRKTFYKLWIDQAVDKYSKKGVAEQGYGNHPSQRVDPRTGKKYVPPKSPLGQGVAEVFNGDKETGVTHKGGIVKKSAGGIKHTKTDYDDGHKERGRKSSGKESQYKRTPILDKDADVDEGWLKNTVAGAAIAGAALGAQARVTPGQDDPNINRLTGKPNVTQVAPADQKPAVQAPAGFSKEYLQSVVDGKHPRPLISVEKAQQLLKQMQEAVAEADMNRRGFLKGMGATALTGVGASSQAQSEWQQDLGNGFVTAKATIDGVTYRAIQDTISKSGYMLNQRSDGTPIVNRPGEFLVVRNGKIEARPEIAPNIMRALQKAGILPVASGEVPAQTPPAVTHSSHGGTNQPAVTHSSRNGTNQPAVTYSAGSKRMRNEETATRMKMGDYIKAAEELQDRLSQAIKQGDRDLIKKLSKERDELDARITKHGLMPESQLDEISNEKLSQYKTAAAADAGRAHARHAPRHVEDSAGGGHFVGGHAHG
jgi:hypothetical protein